MFFALLLLHLIMLIFACAITAIFAVLSAKAVSDNILLLCVTFITLTEKRKPKGV